MTGKINMTNLYDSDVEHGYVPQNVYRTRSESVGGTVH